MIFDVFVILVFIISVIINIRRGAAGALARFIASIIAYFAAAALGEWIAQGAYEIFVRPAIEKAVSGAVANAGTQAADSVVSALPSWLTGLLNLSAEELTNTFSDPISNVSGTVTTAVNDAVKPVACGILTFFITILVFMILMILLRWIVVKPLVRLFRFPGLNVLNRIGGAVIGVVGAFLLVCMTAYLIKLILVNVGSNSSWFNESTINNSFIFYHFYSGNIFTWISSLISG